MSKFLTGNKLNAELEEIFEKAYEKLVLISPYIKLHDRYSFHLRSKKGDPNFKIIILFGKNEEDISKSMKEEDFNFFKEFQNIEIRYEKILHAKYYANEVSAILTSMNLYSYSHDNNIEAGILMTVKFFDDIDLQAEEYFQEVIAQSKLLFKKVPQYESSAFGFKKTYVNSIIETDELSSFFHSNQISRSAIKEDHYEKKKNESSNSGTKKNTNDGFCIRTGKPIPFNLKRPMCDEAFRNWSKFSNEDYPEKYCHYSGEPSNGETTYSKPVLRKYWNKIKA